MMQHSEKLKITAVHEAAHFVTYLLYYGNEFEFNHEVNLLTIAPFEDNLGYFKHEPLSIVESDRREVKFILSGYAGEYMISNKVDISKFLQMKLKKGFNGDGTDADKAIDWVLSLEVKKKTDKKTLKVIPILYPYFHNVIEDLANNWRLVERVVDQLLIEKTIQGDNLKSLWDEILDGLKS